MIEISVEPSGGAGSSVFQGAPTGLINSSNVNYTLPHSPTSSAAVKVFLNGLLQIPTTHYSITGTALTMVSAPNTGDDLIVDFTY